MTLAPKEDILHIQLMWWNAIRGFNLSYRVEVSEEMASRWINCYGMEIIEYTLPIAAKNWQKKREKEGEDLEDFDYLRNYVQACMLDNRDAGKFNLKKVVSA